MYEISNEQSEPKPYDLDGVLTAINAISQFSNAY